jgi:hypothetical protein
VSTKPAAAQIGEVATKPKRCSQCNRLLDVLQQCNQILAACDRIDAKLDRMTSKKEKTK